MRTVPYGGGSLEIPERPFRLDPVPVPRAPRAADDSWEDAFDRPIGSPSLRETFRCARRVLIAVSDGTRRTGGERFLPALLERLSTTGGPRVSFIMGGGIHRPTTTTEVKRLLGPAIAGRHPVIHHDPDDESRLVGQGTTRAGTPVRVNRAVREHDRLVLTGVVGFHYHAGFSGGRKAVVPGLAARETIVRNHLRALRRDGTRHPRARAGCLDGNPVHRDMTEAAAMVDPHLLVNSVLDEQGRIERLFVGHWRRAHEAACRYLRGTRRVRLAPRKLVLASAGGWPYDLDLIQSHKAFETAFPVLEPGGVLILVARCSRGSGSRDFVRWFRHGGEREMARALQREFRVYGQTALSWFRKAARCRLILVSGLDAARVRLIAAEPARDLREAFRLASRYLPRDTRGWLIRRGSQWLLEPLRGGT